MYRLEVALTKAQPGQPDLVLAGSDLTISDGSWCYSGGETNLFGVLPTVELRASSTSPGRVFA